jgi:hypothetical protein
LQSKNEDKDENQPNNHLHNAVGLWKPTSDVGFVGLGEDVGDEGKEDEDARWDEDAENKRVAPF